MDPQSQSAVSGIYSGVGQLAQKAPTWINTAMGWIGIFVAKWQKELLILLGLWIVSHMLKINYKSGR